MGADAGGRRRPTASVIARGTAQGRPSLHTRQDNSTAAGSGSATLESEHGYARNAGIDPRGPWARGVLRRHLHNRLTPAKRITHRR